MAPREVQQPQPRIRRRNEEEDLKEPRGYISEDMISPISFLRSDRFVESGLTAKSPSQGQISAQEYTRPTQSFMDAVPRVRCQRDQEALENAPQNTILQCPMGAKPQRVGPKSVDNFMEQKVLTYPAFEQSNFHNCYHEITDINFVQTGRSSNSSFRSQMNQSSLNTRTRNMDTDKDYNGGPHTPKRSPPTTTLEHQVLQLARPSVLGTEPERALLSQSPIRSSSAPSSNEQFQPSPLKSRPMTAITGRPSQMKSGSSNFEAQLHEHIRAFQAQQELSPPGSRISISPLMNRQGTASEDWAEEHQLPDPSMVKQSQPSAGINNVTLNSTERLTEALEQLTSTSTPAIC